MFDRYEFYKNTLLPGLELVNGLISVFTLGAYVLKWHWVFEPALPLLIISVRLPDIFPNVTSEMRKKTQ